MKIRSPLIPIALIVAFLMNMLGPLPSRAEDLSLPMPGVRVHLSPEYKPPILKGIKVHPDNPFQFEFILDRGDRPSSLLTVATEEQALKSESTKLIKYFLASMTVPEKDLWVNLSPYEKQRIIPASFGLTEMGRDLLAQDYILKQITASLIYPEDEIGKKFWKRFYDEAAKKYHTTNIPVNTFNRVWIVPQKAVVYENSKLGTAYVVESRLKVMLEEDYVAGYHQGSSEHRKPLLQDTSMFGNQIIREIVIPELEREVNEGMNFAQLRQVYSSLILAQWYKKKIKDSMLAKVYADRNKIEGLSPIRGGVLKQEEQTDVQAIYQRYLTAFKKGVYNYIKEEADPITQQVMPRKYFSGGFTALGVADMIQQASPDQAATAIQALGVGRAMKVSVGIAPAADQAMNADSSVESIKQALTDFTKKVEEALAKPGVNEWVVKDDEQIELIGLVNSNGTAKVGVNLLGADIPTYTSLGVGHKVQSVKVKGAKRHEVGSVWVMVDVIDKDGKLIQMGLRPILGDKVKIESKLKLTLDLEDFNKQAKEALAKPGVREWVVKDDEQIELIGLVTISNGTAKAGINLLGIDIARTTALGVGVEVQSVKLIGAKKDEAGDVWVMVDVIDKEGKLTQRSLRPIREGEEIRVESTLKLTLDLEDFNKQAKEALARLGVNEWVVKDDKQIELIGLVASNGIAKEGINLLGTDIPTYTSLGVGHKVQSVKVIGVKKDEAGGVWVMVDVIDKDGKLIQMGLRPIREGKEVRVESTLKLTLDLEDFNKQAKEALAKPEVNEWVVKDGEQIELISLVTSVGIAKEGINLLGTDIPRMTTLGVGLKVQSVKVIGAKKDEAGDVWVMMDVKDKEGKLTQMGLRPKREGEGEDVRVESTLKLTLDLGDFNKQAKQALAKPGVREWVVKDIKQIELIGLVTSSGQAKAGMNLLGTDIPTSTPLGVGNKVQSVKVIGAQKKSEHAWVMFKVINQYGKAFAMHGRWDVKENKWIYERENLPTAEEQKDIKRKEFKTVLEGIFGTINEEHVWEYAEIIFLLNPERFKGYSLWDLMPDVFFKEGKLRTGFMSTTGIAYGDIAKQIAELQHKLDQYKGSDKQTIENKIIALGYMKYMTLYKPRFIQEEQGLVEVITQERNRLYESNNLAAAMSLDQVLAYHQKIESLKTEINQKGILRAGKNLSWAQLENIMRMRQEKRVILGDDPGLGKTVQMIVLALLVEAKEIMMLTGPLMGKASFERDVKEWIAENKRPQVIVVDGQMDDATRKNLLASMAEDRQVKNLERPRMTVWNFHYLRGQKEEALKGLQLDFLGLDEVQFLKNEESLNTQAVQHLEAPYKVLSTGTPVDDDLDDVRVLFKMLLQEKGDEWSATIREYLESEGKFSQIFNSQFVDRILTLRQAVQTKLVRQEIEEVLQGYLPIKQEGNLVLDWQTGTMTATIDKEEISESLKEEGETDPFIKQRKLYEALYRWIQEQEDPRYYLTGIGMMKHIQEDPQAVVEAARAEADPSELKQFIKNTADKLDEQYSDIPWVSIKQRALVRLKAKHEGQSMLIFAPHVEGLKRASSLWQEGQSGLIIGETSEEERKRIREDFQAGRIQAVAASYQTAAQAADFTQAEVMVMNSEADRRSLYRQAIGRMMRRSDNGAHPHTKVMIWHMQIKGDEEAPSADEHFERLLEFKMAAARLFEKGQFTPGLIEEFRLMDQKRSAGFFKPAPTAAQQLTIGMMEAIKHSQDGDYAKAQAKWEEIAFLYGQHADSIATHSMEVAGWLRLARLIKEGKIKRPDAPMKIAFVPSGTAIGAKVMHQLRGLLKEVGIALEDESGKQVIEINSLDFSPAMQTQGRGILGQLGLKWNEHTVNVVEETFPMADKSQDLLNSTELWTFAKDGVNQQGVNPRVWFLSQANRVLKTGGILMLSVHNAQFSKDLIEALKENYGFELVEDSYGQELRFDTRQLKSQVGDAFARQIKKMRQHTEASSAIFLRKSLDMRQDLEYLKGLDGNKISFDTETQEPREEAEQSQVRGYVEVSELNFDGFPWGQLSVEALMMPDQQLSRKQLRAKYGELYTTLLGWMDGRIIYDRLEATLKFQKDQDVNRYQTFKKMVEEAHELTQRIGDDEEFRYIISFVNKTAQVVTAMQSLGVDRAMTQHIDIKNEATNKTGGVDLTSDKVLQIKNEEEGIVFHLDDAMLAKLQNSSGFVPEIISIQPMDNVYMFLGVHQ